MATTPVPLTKEQKIELAEKYVHESYAALAKMVGESFKMRHAQVDLSIHVARTLLRSEDKNLLLSEAPTGTGKTIGYMIGAIAAQKADSVLAANPVIIATATKALQHQLMANDAPTLASCGIVDGSKVVLAKGRANYVCIADAQQMRQRSAQAILDIEEYMPEGMENLSPSDIDAMLEAYERREWDGDFDHYNSSSTKQLRALGSNSDTCVRSKCAHKDNCPYFSARDALKTAQVIVTNHDIMMLDLKKSFGEEETSLPVSQFNLIVDEAHHLGDKTLQIASAELEVAAARLMLKRRGAVSKLISKDADLQKYLIAKRIDVSSLTDNLLEVTMGELYTMLTSIELPEGETTHRFPSAAVPAELRSLASQLFKVAIPVSNAFSNIVAAFKQLEETKVRAIQENRREIRLRCFEQLRQLSSIIDTASAFSSVDRMARWMYRRGDAVALHATPIHPGEYLNNYAWTNGAVNSVTMVSATLRDLGSYDGILHSYGIPRDKLTELTLPYTFPYEESTLKVVAMRYSPKQGERRSFLTELNEKLPKEIDPKEATLVLVSSWGNLRELSPILKRHFGEETVKVQGETPVKYLLQKHKEHIDSGKGSILLGVATMAEGMDLPGKYCTHVAICTLPFAVPTNPLEQELQEMLGKDYFSKRSLPDAMRKLTQMVGRLLRKEEDRGRVTLFDNRMANTGYGRKMLANLPPFKRVIEKLPAPTEEEMFAFDENFNPGYSHN